MSNFTKWTRQTVMLGGGMLAVVLGVLAMPTAAQQQTEEENAADPAFHEKFWDYLKEADYQKNWSRWPGHEQEFQEGTSPHGALLKVYVNDAAKANLQDPPVKSIIVKENYNENKELVAITPMYRVGKDYDPDHNDWYWVKYGPDGTVDKADGKPISGRVEGCIKCHDSAKGNDYIFNNDQG